jgi:hypothetical protein
MLSSAAFEATEMMSRDQDSLPLTAIQPCCHMETETETKAPHFRDSAKRPDAAPEDVHRNFSTNQYPLPISFTLSPQPYAQFLYHPTACKTSRSCRAKWPQASGVIAT